MKISIITITYNSESTVEDTIKSVVSQDFPNVEYIIVDGLSKDKTLSVVSRYSQYIDKVVSEKDKGLYDALNKGIHLATGDVIGMLHSDDIYASSQVLSKIAQQFAMDTSVEAVYADLVFVDRNDTNKVLRTWKAGKYEEDAFKNGWMPPHPTFFVKKSVYDRFGGFNLGLKLSADYELMLRVLLKHKIDASYLPQVLVKMRRGGFSNAKLVHRLRANREDFNAWQINGLKPNLLTRYLKPLRKIPQFLFR